MSEPRRALVLGATGLVGGLVLDRDARVDGWRFTGLARRAAAQPRGDAQVIVAPVPNWPNAIGKLAPHAVICALGTTWRKAGRRRSAFRAVDHDLVLFCAQAARAAGTSHFIHVSAVGAHTNSVVFYLRVKGETEAELARRRFTRLDILRPGLLKGSRKNDLRLGESLAGLVSPLFDRVLRGKLADYRSLAAIDVASAALTLVDQTAPGRFVHRGRAIRNLSRQLDGPT